MDTSKEYIEMCRKAVEIQELWEPKKGDFFLLNPYDPLHKRFAIMVLGCHWEKCQGCSHEISDEKCVWLPRQDQLQEMVDWESRGENGTFYQIEALKDWASREINDMKYSNSDEAFNDKYDTFEKVWLAFVMHEKYGKKWSGGEWIIPEINK